MMYELCLWMTGSEDPAYATGALVFDGSVILGVLDH